MENVNKRKSEVIGSMEKGSKRKSEVTGSMENGSMENGMNWKGIMRSCDNAELRVMELEMIQKLTIDKDHEKSSIKRFKPWLFQIWERHCVKICFHVHNQKLLE